MVLFWQLLFLTPNIIQSQELFSLSGSIEFSNGDKGNSLVVSLYKTADSSRLVSTLSNENGDFRFSKIPRGEYIIGVDYSRSKSKIFPQKYSVGPSINDIRIQLDAPIESLGGVTVVSQRPFLQRQSDRLVVNLENSALTKGNSLLEALPKLPGIDVLQGKITVNGGGDILLVIDGTSYKSSSDQAIQLLRSLRSDNIEKIEIYTTPPARFEAEGSSVINVILKKDKMYSSVNVSYGQRLFPEASEAGFPLHQAAVSGNFNYGIGKLKVNARAGYTSSSTSYTRESSAVLFTDGKRTNEALTTADNTTVFFNGTANYITPHETFGLTFGLNQTLPTHIYSNNLDLFINNGNTTDSSFISSIHTRNTSANPVWLLSYDNLINIVKAQSVSITLISGTYRNLYDIDQLVTEQPNSLNLVTQQQDFSVNAQALKLDYAQKAGAIGKIEAGLKLTHVSNHDNYEFQPGSSQFHFREDIDAGYVAASNTFKSKLSYTAGLRVEYTHNSAESSVVTDAKIKRSYTDLFPSFSLQYPVREKVRVGLAYSRRIARPSYNNFNPANFILFNDAFANQSGNAGLKPLYISKYELSAQCGRLYTALTYSHRTNIRSTVAADTNRIISYRVVNISGDDANLLVNYTFTAGKKLELGFDASGQYYSFHLLHSVTQNSFTWRISHNETLTLSPTLKTNLAIRYYSSYRLEYFRRKAFYTIDAGFIKSFPKKNITVAFSVSDIPGANRPEWTYYYPDFTRTLKTLTNERLFTLTIAYRFKTTDVFQLKRKQTDEFGETRFYK
jgi:hypothetical protein